MGNLSDRLAALVIVAAAFGGPGCAVTSGIFGSEKRNVYKFDHPFAVEDANFRRSAEALGNFMVGGNDASLLINGDEIFPAMTRDIREARTSVYLETYIFQPDEAGSLAFYDRGFAQKVEAMFQEDKKRCEEITFQAWKSLGLTRRLAEVVSWIWEPYY